MKIQNTCIAILLALGFLTATASADQSCKFTLNNASKIGAQELSPGDYKLVVDAPKVVLTELKTGKSIELEAKIETTDMKSSSTEVHTRQVDGTSQISEIRNGVSKTKITFE
jgi:hypothetical protein